VTGFFPPSFEVPVLAHPFAKGSPVQKPARGAEICAGSGRYEAHVGVAQLVEHRFCKPKVRGSSPLASSNGVSRAAERRRIVGRRSSHVCFSEGCPSGQREQAVNLPASAYVGSNPSPSTSPFRTLARLEGGLGRPGRMVRTGGFQLSGLGTPKRATQSAFSAGVAQLVERQPSKLNVVGSSPISRSAVDRNRTQVARRRRAAFALTLTGVGGGPSPISRSAVDRNRTQVARRRRAAFALTLTGVGGGPSPISRSAVDRSRTQVARRRRAAFALTLTGVGGGPSPISRSAVDSTPRSDRFESDFQVTR
jgi:hypothetical protein